MTEEAGGFFSRWSQRKQAVKLGIAEEEKAPEKILNPAPSGTAPLATVQQDMAETKAESVKLPTLADVEQLTPQSDFSTFMTQGVSPDVRNAAMKKLFTDPHYNVMDGLDIYIGDYNTPDPLPAGMLEKMVGAELLNLFPKKDPADTPQTEASEAQENHAKSPDETQVSPLVAQSPSSTTQALQPIPALQASETTAHDHPDLQLQPNHAPASPSPGASTG